MEDLPLFMLVNPHEEKIDWFEPMPEISGEKLADFVASIVFYDLFETILKADPDQDFLDAMGSIAEAYVRGRPPPRKTPEEDGEKPTKP